MKMVAAAKYARAEKQLKPARVYGTGALGTYTLPPCYLSLDMKRLLLLIVFKSFWQWTKIPLFPVCSPALYEKADIKAAEDKAAKHLLIGVTSDRGLCGAIHSGVAKAIKSEIAALTSAGKEVMVVNVGDKLRGLLHRYD